jgi:hypothetical protein
MPAEHDDQPKSEYPLVDIKEDRRVAGEAESHSRGRHYQPDDHHPAHQESEPVGKCVGGVLVLGCGPGIHSRQLAVTQRSEATQRCRQRE